MRVQGGVWGWEQSTALGALGQEGGDRIMGRSALSTLPSPCSHPKSITTPHLRFSNIPIMMMGVRVREVGMRDLGWEYGDRSMGMWAWGWEHDDTVGQISQISIVWYVGQITQISIVKSVSLWILCYGFIGVSWMAPCQSFWIKSFTFHDVLLTAFCHHYFGCIVYLIVFFCFVCHMLLFVSFSLYAIASCIWYCVWIIFLLYDLKTFSTKHLLLSFQLYQKIVSAYDMLLWRIFWWWTLLFLCNILYLTIFTSCYILTKDKNEWTS